MFQKISTKGDASQLVPEALDLLSHLGPSFKLRASKSILEKELKNSNGVIHHRLYTLIKFVEERSSKHYSTSDDEKYTTTVDAINKLIRNKMLQHDVTSCESNVVIYCLLFPVALNNPRIHKAYQDAVSCETNPILRWYLLKQQLRSKSDHKILERILEESEKRKKEQGYIGAALACDIFYNELEASYIKKHFHEHMIYSPSLSIENNFVNSFLSNPSSSLVQSSSLLFDRLLSAVALNAPSSSSEILYLLTLIHRFNLLDSTSRLKALMAKFELKHVSLTNLVFILHYLVIRQETLQFCTMEALNEYTAQILSRLENKQARLISFNKNYINSPINMFALVSPSQTMSDCIEFYNKLRLMLEEPTGLNDEVAMKDLVELVNFLTHDYSVNSNSNISKILANAANNLDRLKETDMLILLKSCIVAKIRQRCWNKTTPDNPIVLISEGDYVKICSAVDEAYKPNSGPMKQPGIKMLSSILPYVDNEPDLLPNLHKLCNSNLNNLVRGGLQSRPPQSGPEAEVLKAIQENPQLKVIAVNSRVEEKYEVDVVLEHQVLVEVNGKRHETSGGRGGGAYGYGGGGEVVHMRGEDVVRYEYMKQRGYSICIIHVHEHMDVEMLMRIIHNNNNKE